MRRGIFLAALGLLLAVGASPALAQTTTTGYQPGGCNASTFLGSTAPGGTVSGTLGPGCPFTGQITITVNGTPAPTRKIANSNGGVNVVIQIVSTTQGLLNDPDPVAVHVGNNTVSATGAVQGGGTATANGSFAVTAPASAAAPVTPPTSRVAFTGANVLRWSLAAVALLGIGALMVWGSRRRRSTLD